MQQARKALQRIREKSCGCKIKHECDQRCLGSHQQRQRVGLAVCHRSDSATIAMDAQHTDRFGRIKWRTQLHRQQRATVHGGNALLRAVAQHLSPH